MTARALSLLQFVSEVQSIIRGFPKRQILEYLSKYRPQTQEIQSALHNMHRIYLAEATHFKPLVILLYIAVSRIDILDQTLSFLEELGTTKMMTHAYEGGRFVLYDYLQYIEELVSVVVEHCLDNNLSFRLADSLTTINSSGLTNSVNFLVEAILILKIKSHLSLDSLAEFNTFLQTILNREKHQYFLKIDKATTLKFQRTALLRCRDESYETYGLCVGATDRMQLVKSEQKAEDWIIDAFERVPKKEECHILQKMMAAKEVGEMYEFMMKLEIFGSSPLIQELNDYLPSDQALEFFSNFLQGEALARKQYEFGWLRVRRVLEEMDRSLKAMRVAECYKGAMGREVGRILGADR